jgi:2-C-methyl-D-erythritol 2,4-cyclodiphosphate synthase
VVLHAICDALLGALALGDIGQHFADTDARFKNIDSKILLARTYALVREKGWKVGNVDCALILQEPKIASFIPGMQAAIAPILEVETDAVSIKATTAEQMGFAGERKGVEAQAVCLVYKEA